MKFLFDECLHTSLRELAFAAGFQADHVTFLKLGGTKDWDLVRFVLGRDYTFVTNNLSDFWALYRRARLHAGLVILVPSVTPERQRQLFAAVLGHIGHRELANAIIEADFDGNEIRCTEYRFPRT